MHPKLVDWEGERVPKIDEIWMLACIKKSLKNSVFFLGEIHIFIKFHFSHSMLRVIEHVPKTKGLGRRKGPKNR